MNEIAALRKMIDDTPIEWRTDGLHVEVSPCSWMHANYGLQLRVSLTPDACNAESEFLNDKSIPWSHATRATTDRMVSEFLAKDGLAKLHQNVANWAKASAEFDKEIAADNKREAARIKRLDAKYRKQGCTHRVDAWIHPSRGGDDYQVSIYARGEPSKTEIATKLKRSGSSRTDDFQIFSI